MSAGGAAAGAERVQAPAGPRTRECGLVTSLERAGKWFLYFLIDSCHATADSHTFTVFLADVFS